MRWLSGEGADVLADAQRAVDLLEPARPDGTELAHAYATLAQCFLVTGSGEAPAMRYAKRALELAERCGAEAVAVDASTTLGVAELFAGKEGGWRTLQIALRRSRTAGFDSETGRVLVNLVEAGRDLRNYPVADRYRAEALAHVTERGAERIFLRRRLLSDLAQLDLERGRWVDAEQMARAALDLPDVGALIRVRALTVLGRLRARRGDADPWGLLDAAASLAVEDNVPLAAARAEAAWLSGELPRGQREAQLGLEQAERSPAEDPWWRGELAFWAWKTGCRVVLRPDTPEPFCMHAAGRFREAAACWRAIGCPYEEALALADSTEEGDLRSALEIFHTLGAQPMATVVARTLRERGARAIPRGPRASTARNPAHLTRRELEVLDLIGAGLRNAEIAERLVVAPKTVQNHVSAIMKKLGVGNRAAAAEKAASLRIQR
jgi:DNA-binding CsgD family transcriptional regulator